MNIDTNESGKVIVAQNRQRRAPQQ